MAKSTKSVSKKVVAPVEAPVPVVAASVVASAPAPSAPVPAKVKKEPKVKAERQPESAETKWARRLGRWQAKAVAQGVDARALMTKALAG